MKPSLLRQACDENQMRSAIVGMPAPAPERYAVVYVRGRAGPIIGAMSETALAGQRFVAIQPLRRDGVTEPPECFNPAHVTRFREISREQALGILGLPALDLERIDREVALYFKLPEGALHSRTRSWHTSYPRHVAMFLMREVSGASFPKIGEYFGMDHGTVMYAKRHIEDLIISNDPLAAHVAAIRRNLAPEVKAA